MRLRKRVGELENLLEGRKKETKGEESQIKEAQNKVHTKTSKFT